MLRMITILSIFLCTQNISVADNSSIEENSQSQWFSAPPSPKVIPSEAYPSWKENFDENILCYEGDCGYEQRGPLFFILRGQENLILL